VTLANAVQRVLEIDNVTMKLGVDRHEHSQ